MTWQTDTAARTLAQEVRGEPLAGQIAVAWVIRNRMESGRWGASLASVCLWHAQFSGWWSPRGNPPKADPNFAYACDMRDDDPMVEHMSQIIAEVMGAPDDQDPTGGALYYCNLALAKPDWLPRVQQTVVIGHHTFFRDPQPAALTS